jgi:membrane-bound metal-dependent hydrolase YbcI (DUF457 family)
VFVGHGLLAFALAAVAARLFGWSHERALTLGLFAGLFGLAPDVDVVYALVGLSGAETAMGAATGFWSASAAVHRVITHSFLIAAVAAVAAGALTGPGRRTRLGGGLLLGALVGVAGAVTGTLAAGVMAVFVLTVAALAVGARRVGLSPRGVAAAAAVGLGSHPPGDLLTGEPPAMLYPLDAGIVVARPAVFADPTLNLLAPLYLELATAWLAVGAYLWLTDGLPALRGRLRGRAAIGVGFGGAALFVPPPTLDVSYHFVFPLVGLGAAAAAPLPGIEVRSLADLRDQPLSVAVTALAAVSLGVFAYTVAYLVA